MEHAIVLSVLCQFLPGLRDVHKLSGGGVDGVELHHRVWVNFVDSLELYEVVVQCETQKLAKVLLHIHSVRVCVREILLKYEGLSSLHTGSYTHRQTYSTYVRTYV